MQQHYLFWRFSMNRTRALVAMCLLIISSAYEGYSQPIIGITQFNSNVGSIGFNQSTPFSTNIEGWTLTVRGATTAGMSNFIGVVNMFSNGTITSFDFASNDGSELQLDNFVVRFNDASMSGQSYIVTGYRDGSITGATTSAIVSLGALTTIDVSSSPDFDNIDEFRVSFTGSPSGGISLDEITISPASPSNTPPTAASFTAANGPFQGLAYTFATADFGYMDSDGDPLSSIRIPTVPASGTLYVDANGNDMLDGGEGLTNGSIVSVADLDAGNLQYFTNVVANTTFTFDVNDGTDFSTTTYTATLNITSIPDVVINLGSASLAEADPNEVLTATLSNAYGADVTVNLGFSGTAILGTDYTVTGTLITIPAGTTNASIAIDPIDDLLDEDDETVIIDIVTVTNGNESGIQQETLTITDNDAEPTVALSLGGSPLAENGGVATVTATLSAASGKDVTVNYAFTGTAINAVDYSTSASSIMIPAGNTSGDITITGINDVLDEDDETVVVDITSVTNASEFGGFQQATAFITDDDGPPTVTLAVSGSPISENGGLATITASLSRLSGKDVTINLGFGGSAFGSGVDYSVSSTSITIPAGFPTGDITITGTNDLIDEDDETVIVDITSVINATESGVQQVTAIINDDELLPDVTLALSGSPIAENGGVATITATLSAVSGRDININLSFSGTATGGGVDYTASGNTIFIPAGSFSGTINITGVDDLDDETDETVIVDLASVTNGNEVGTQQVTVVITDDEDLLVPNITTTSPQVVCSADDVTINLDGSEVGVTYEILVNGAGSGVTTVGTGAPIGITITAGNFGNNDVLTVKADNGISTALVNGSITIDINNPAVQNITTPDPLVVCSVDDVTIDLDGSELGVTYEILVNGATSGFTAAGTGAPISLTITDGNFGDGDVLTVEGDNGQCQTIMNGSVTINFNVPAIQNITTTDPLVVCSVDDVTIDLDGSEVGVTYEVLVNGAASGFTEAGTGTPLSITLTTGNYGDGDVLTIQVDNGQCTAIMNGSVTIFFDDPAIQNITSASPQVVSNMDDVTIDLDGSEIGATYEVLVNGIGSSFSAAGTGAAISLTITSGNFADGDVLTVQATSSISSCLVLMNGNVIIDINDGAPVTCEGNVTLTTQAEVDAFDCNILVGRLTINGSDITDLTPLQSLTRVDFGVFIVNNPNLTSLAGLEHLESIQNTLLISNNPGLTDLSGLSGLSGSIGRIEITNNASLTSVAGIPNVSRINNRLRIAGNQSLTSLQGFQSLTWSNIVIIENSNAITSLQGFEGLDIVRFVVISNNATLSSIDELAALDVNNAFLLLVDINNNPLLSQCCILDGLVGLPNLDLQVSGNDTGCESVADITLTCAASMAQATLFPNPLTNSSRIDLQVAEDYNQAQVIVSDMVNGVVLTRDFNQGQVYLDRSEFQKGIYFCQVIVDGEPVQMIRMLVE
ncbi:MAG: Calx-beta domain-containing protein [Bacteroidota bacterium]